MANYEVGTDQNWTCRLQGQVQVQIEQTNKIRIDQCVSRKKNWEVEFENWRVREEGEDRENKNKGREEA